jgi:SAM-dependent methyltransferase
MKIWRGLSRSWQDRYYSRFYYEKPGYIEGTLEFYNLCTEYCVPNANILEIGAGPSNRTSRFLATLGTVHGIDPDPDVRTNDALQSATVMHGDAFPVADSSFDCCVSDYVIEHIGDGTAHLREVARALRPGGVYVFRTVNRFYYAALIASVTPHRFHTLVANRARALPEGTHDPYPTLYAMNTVKAITRAADMAGLTIERIERVEKEPPYGKFSRVAFLIMLAYERLVNSSARFAGLRANFFVVLRKAC